jgi:hypothetical protein
MLVGSQPPPKEAATLKKVLIAAASVLALAFAAPAAHADSQWCSVNPIDPFHGIYNSDPIFAEGITNCGSSGAHIYQSVTLEQLVSTGWQAVPGGGLGGTGSNAVNTCTCTRLDTYPTNFWPVEGRYYRTKDVVNVNYTGNSTFYSNGYKWP